MPDAAGLVAERLRCKQKGGFWYFCVTYGYVLNPQKTGTTKFIPWEYLKEIADALEAGDSVMIGKARQLGLSWLIALYDAWLLTFHRERKILSISIGQRESVELLEKVRFVLDNLPPWLRLSRLKDNETTITLSNKSTITALPSTPNAGRGGTGSVVQTDEFAFHPYAGANFASYASAVADGGQHIIVTTGNGPAGMFPNMWADPNSGYRKWFLPWSVRPDRDQAWYDREKARFLSAGDKHPLLFVRENPSTVEEMLTAFVGLVYDMFDPGVHMAEAKVRYEDCQFRVAAVDPGQGDPAAITVQGQYQDGTELVSDDNNPSITVEKPRLVSHVYGPVFYKPGITSADEIYAYLKRWHLRAPLHAVVVDGAEGTLIATLNAWFERDFGVRPAVAANKERGMGIGLVAGRLRAVKLTVDPTEDSVKHEAQSYRWTERRAAGEGDPYTTSTPVDHHADLLDTIRYGIVWLATYGRSRKAEVSVPAYPRQDSDRPQYALPEPKYGQPQHETATPRTTVRNGSRLGPDYRRRTTVRSARMGRR